ncbi:MAG: PepSY-associated TM helix domain-containing protein [Myxococcota bacterium]|jgi:uncharacterized iron-regulated membrane protein|nr:PepSY-associated TM helix domain-containing protein [Myxococcota bacterium]
MTFSPSKFARAAALQIHLWLGMVSGIIVTIVCLTGAMLSFEEEIVHATHPELYTVEVSGERMPLEDLSRRVSEEYKDVDVGSFSISPEPTRSVEVSVGRGDTIFVNPYSGEVLGRRVYRETAFFTVFSLHRWLLAGKVGKMIVGSATLMFCIIVLTGIWVWWPKSMRMLRRRLKVKTNGGSKRLVFDLHVSVGIYVAIFLFIMGFTGLRWSFEWFEQGLYVVTNSKKERTKPPEPLETAKAESIPYDEALRVGQEVLGPAKSYRISIPSEKSPVYAIRAVPDDAAHAKASDTVYIDPVEGSLLRRDRFEARSGGDRLKSTFYALHTGEIYGMWTRILAFLAALIGATMPLTGALIWWNKRSPKWRANRERRRAAMDDAESN